MIPRSQSRISVRDLLFRADGIYSGLSVRSQISTLRGTLLRGCGFAVGGAGILPQSDGKRQAIDAVARNGRSVFFGHAVFPTFSDFARQCSLVLQVDVTDAR